MSRRDKKAEPPMSFFSFQDIIACTTGIMVIIALMLMLELVQRTTGAKDRAATPVDPNLIGRLEAARKELHRAKGDVEEARKILANSGGGLIVTRTQVDGIEKRIQGLESQKRGMEASLDEAKARFAKAENELSVGKGKLPPILDEAKRLAALVEQIKNRPKVAFIGGNPARKTPYLVECAPGLFTVFTIADEGPTQGVPKEVQKFAGEDAHLAFLRWAKQNLNPAKDFFDLLVRPTAVEQFVAVREGLMSPGPTKFDVGWDFWPAEKSLSKPPAPK